MLASLAFSFFFQIYEQTLYTNRCTIQGGPEDKNILTECPFRDNQQLQKKSMFGMGSSEGVGSRTRIYSQSIPSEIINNYRTSID